MLEEDSTERICIFGYGSLIWKPNFAYTKREVGYIEGYQRRFYQGTTKHRGTPNNPGRVATLINSCRSDSRVWGCAYEIVGEDNIDAALSHLNDREVVHGGYRRESLKFNPLSSNDVWAPLAAPNAITKAVSSTGPYKVWTYISGPESASYLGYAALVHQAAQIASAHGECGANSEYALQLVTFMINEVPKDLGILDDPYIFELERLIKEQVDVERNTRE